MIEIQGKKLLYFRNEYRVFNIDNMQNAPSLINNQHITNQIINPNSNINNNNFVFNDIKFNDNGLNNIYIIFNFGT